VADLSQDSLVRLQGAPVKRHLIVKEIGVEKGIRFILQREAKKLQPAHVVERRFKGQQFEVEYHLRPAAKDEVPGEIKELD